MRMECRVKRKVASDVCVPRGCNAAYDASKPFTFQVLSWEAFDEGEVPFPESRPDGSENKWFPEDREFAVYLFGSTSKGNSVAVRTTFQPSFLVKLGRLDDEDRQWSRGEITSFVNNFLLGKIRVDRRGCDRRTPCYYRVAADPEARTKQERDESTVLLSYDSAFVCWKELWLRDLDAGFTGPEPRRFQYVRLTFRTLRAMQSCARKVAQPATAKMLARKRKTAHVYEANLEPHIRLMHLTGVHPTGWVKLPAGAYSFVACADVMRTQVRVRVPEWRSLQPVDKPRLARFRSASVDLETYTPSDDKFSDASDPACCVLTIATLFTDQGSGRAPQAVVYQLGACDDLGEPDTRLVRFESERQMLLAWQQLILQSDPDVVHAYNGWEFDYPYLVKRAEVLGCWDQFRGLGRLAHRPSRLVARELKSNAYGANVWNLLPMSGRFVYDTMAYVKRAWNPQFISLAYVAQLFLSVKLPPNALTARRGVAELVIRQPGHSVRRGSCVRLTDVPTPERRNVDGKSWYHLAGWTFDELHSLLPVDRVLDADHYVVRMPKPAERDVDSVGSGVKAYETKLDVSFKEMNRAYRERDGATMAAVARYCRQDTAVPQWIMDRKCVLSDLVEMAKVTWVPIEYLVVRGQQIKVFSQLCKAARESSWAVPSNPACDEETPLGYVGGAVLDPFPGFYNDPVSVPDFCALYPSTMIDNNFCLTTLVKDPRYRGLPGVPYNRVEVDPARTHTFAMSYTGLVPQILTGLLNARSRRKKLMSAAQTPEERVLHNGAQLAYKQSANSIYGFFGVQPAQAMIPCMPIAESTTARGRQATFATRSYAENLDNFRDIVQCTTHFPPDYVYLMKDVAKGSCFHLTGRKLLGALGTAPADVPLAPATAPVACDELVTWTSAGWEPVVAVSRKREPFFPGVDLLCFHSPRGRTLDMQAYACRALDAPAVRSTDVPEAERTSETAIRLAGQNLCTTVYGDTDSVFLLIDSRHLRGTTMRVAYCGIVAAYIAGRVTAYLRALNPFKPPEEQWMELEFEKTYRALLLFSRKRYAGMMSEFDPERYTEDKKGVAMKRRDFCALVKEIYGKILHALFDDTEGMAREDLIQNALSVVREAIEDLVNNRVPFPHLVISKLLRDQYSVREKTQCAGSKLCDFSQANVNVGDEVFWREGRTVRRGVVTQLAERASFFACSDRPVTVRPTGTLSLEAYARKEEPVSASGEPTRIHYVDIVRRSKSVITLDKIYDPNTTDAELNQITHAHVRLARRMALRDPATAPRSGNRLPYVFCKTGGKDVPQYMRAEDPEYARKHDLQIDSVYYLEHQCANAWGQILDTVAPGLVESLYATAYQRYERKRSVQHTLHELISGNREPTIQLPETSASTIREALASQGSRKQKKQKTVQPSITQFFGARQ